MSCKKHFTKYEPGSGSVSSKTNRWASWLPEVYSGQPNRVERYGQYNTMDMDSEVNAALDILAEFTSQTNQQNKTPFILDFKTKATN